MGLAAIIHLLEASLIPRPGTEWSLGMSLPQSCTISFILMLLFFQGGKKKQVEMLLISLVSIASLFSNKSS